MVEDSARGDGMEIVTVCDSAGRGVYVSCGAEVAPVDLVAGLCELLAQVTRAVLANSRATRAGDLELGGFEIAEDDDFVS